MKIWNSTDDLIIEMKHNNFISKCDCLISTFWNDFEYMNEIKEVSRDVKLSVPSKDIIEWFD
jgi:hypothetical protein